MDNLCKPSLYSFIDSINVLIDVFGMSALVMLIWNTVLIDHITILTSIPYWHAVAIRCAFMSLRGFYNPSNEVFYRKVLKHLKEIKKTSKTIVFSDIERGPIPNTSCIPFATISS